MQIQSFTLAAMRGVVLEIHPAADRVGWHAVARLKGNPAAIVAVRAPASEVRLIHLGDAPHVVASFGDAAFSLTVKEAERLAQLLGVEIERGSP